MQPLCSPEPEAALEEERALGFHERTQAIYDDQDRRKLLLTMEPPELYEMASYMHATQQSATTQVNYLFAENLRVFREPDSGRLVITIDPEVSTRLEAHGYELVAHDIIRTTGEMELRLAAVEAERAAAELERTTAELAQLHVQAMQQMHQETVGNDTPAVSIPPQLFTEFRTDVMTDGNLAAFAAPLMHVVEQEFTWQGRVWSPMSEWSPAACKELWGGLEKQVLDKCEQTVNDMRLVYCMVKRHEAGTSWEAILGCGADGVNAKVTQGTASWTQMRKEARSCAKRASETTRKVVRDAYYADSRLLAGKDE